MPPRAARRSSMQPSPSSPSVATRRPGSTTWPPGRRRQGHALSLLQGQGGPVRGAGARRRIAHPGAGRAAAATPDMKPRRRSSRFSPCSRRRCSAPTASFFCASSLRRGRGFRHWPSSTTAKSSRSGLKLMRDGGAERRRERRVHEDAAARFPQLIVAPLLMAAIWDGMFSRLDPLDVPGLLHAHRELLTGVPRGLRHDTHTDCVAGVAVIAALAVAIGAFAYLRRAADRLAFQGWVEAVSHLCQPGRGGPRGDAGGAGRRCRGSRRAALHARCRPAARGRGRERGFGHQRQANLRPRAGAAEEERSARRRRSTTRKPRCARPRRG